MKVFCRRPHALSCGMPLKVIIQILVTALTWAALGTGLFVLCIRALDWVMH